MPYRRAAGNASARVFPRGSGPFFSGGGPSCSSGFPLSGCRRGAGADPRVPAPQIAGRFRGILGFGERIRRHASCYARASIPPKGLRHAPPPEFFRRPRRLPAGKLQLLIEGPRRRRIAPWVDEDPRRPASETQFRFRGIAEFGVGSR